MGKNTHIVIQEEKTDKPKRFKINTTLQSEIEDYIKGMKPSEYLFLSRTGSKTNSISRVMAYNILNEAGHAAGLGELGTHTPRKAFGYHFYKKYKDVALLQDLFNHSAPSVTLRYNGINQVEQDKAIDDFSLYYIPVTLPLVTRC